MPKIVIACRLYLSIPAFLSVALACGDALGQTASVPSVGCVKGGQVEEVRAPKRPPVTLAIDPQIAARLSYYRAVDGPGVLGPRGWQCYTTIGSSGIGIVVAPRFDGYRNLDSKGPGISHVFFFADTSGRYPAAKVVARLFPQSRTFVERVIAEDVAPASDFPFGPWPDDKLSYVSNSAVRFETPSGKLGQGTQAGFQPSIDPIHGRVRLVEDGVYVLAARLPHGMIDLAETITGEVQPIEKEYSSGKVIEGS